MDQPTSKPTHPRCFPAHFPHFRYFWTMKAPKKIPKLSEPGKISPGKLSEPDKKGQTNPGVKGSGPLVGLSVLPFVAAGACYPGRRLSAEYGLKKDARRWLIPLLCAVKVASLRRGQSYAVAVGRIGDSYRVSSYMRTYAEVGLCVKVGSRWRLTGEGDRLLSLAYEGIIEQWGFILAILPEGEPRDLVTRLIDLFSAQG
jgi:hypothetical protein